MTTLIDNILVSLDGSALAEKALPHAQQLAQQFGATLHLVSVAEGEPEPIERLIGFTWIGQERREEEETVALTKYLQEVEAEIRAEVSAETLTIKSSVVTGNIAEALLDFAEESGVDIIVMATHGRSGVARWALGSIAERVVRLATIPVMLVR